MQPVSHFLISTSGALALASITQAELLSGPVFGVNPLAMAAVAAAAASTCMLPDIDKRIPLMEHRTWTHTVWMGVALMTGVGTLFAGVWALLPFVAPFLGLLYEGVLYGFALHLAADMLTVTGVRLFYPLPQRFFLAPRFLRIVTGSVWEALYALVLVFAAASLFAARWF